MPQADKNRLAFRRWILKSEVSIVGILARNNGNLCRRLETLFLLVLEMPRLTERCFKAMRLGGI